MAVQNWLRKLVSVLSSREGQKALRAFLMSSVASLTVAAVILTMSVLFSREALFRGTQQASSFRNQYFSEADSFIGSLSEPARLANGLKLIFNSLNRESEGQLMEYGYSNILEDYIARLLSDGDAEDDQYTAELMAILVEEKTEEPFAGLPSDARRLFTNLSSAISNGDTSTAQGNLSDIAIQMSTTSSLVSGLRARYSLMLGLAVAGLVATILMGVGTLATQFLRRRRTRPLTEDS